MIALLAMSACGGDRAIQKEAQDAVSHDLRDPSSAQFRDVKVYSKAVCGEINGKNGVGAYAGFARFWYERETKRYRYDPKLSEGDEIDRTNQRIFESEIDRFCKSS